MSDEARVYMARVVPWPTGHGFINLHYPTKRLKNDGKPFFNGTPVQTLDEAVANIHRIQKSSQAQGDIYICMSQQAECEERMLGDGRTFKVAARTQTGALALKSLFIDIDVKEGDKGYANQREALAALGAFVKNAGLPAPTVIVSSGTGGLHVYWTFTGPVSREQWQPMAQALAEATRRTGLKCDTQCTVDAARILRVPGTFNWKTNPPKPVKLLLNSPGPDLEFADIQRALQPYIGATVIPFARPAIVGDEGDEFAAGIDTPGARPVDLITVARSCGFIRRALDTGGADFDNPLWNLTTLIATFAENAEDMAHRMANQHAEYSEEDTANLFDRKVKEKAEKNLGWPKCQSIQNAGCTDCASCPLLSQGRSPLNFGVQAPVPAPTPQGGVNDLPAGYVRDVAGHIKERIDDGTGQVTYREVIPFAMTDAWVQDKPWTLHFETKLGTKGVTSIQVPYEVVGSGEQLRKKLAQQGMGVTPRQTQGLQEFVVAWMNQLKEIQGRMISAQPYGWVQDDKTGTVSGFAYGGKVYGPKGERTAGMHDGLHKIFSPHGKLEVWQEAARKLVTEQGNSSLDIFLAISFGAPLFAWTGQLGALVSAFSQGSGIGKSTAMEVALSVWGHPIMGKQGTDDTTNAISHKMGVLRAMPMFWDELKTEEHYENFSKLLFRTTSGTEKARMKADGGLKEQGIWQSLLMSANNDSILDFLASRSKSSPANLYRVFEFNVTRGQNTLPVGEANKLLIDLRHNYGVAGAIYAKFLGENAEAVREEVVEAQNKLSSELGFTTEERFWVAICASALVGAKIANRIGLTDINTGNLLSFLATIYVKMREHVKGAPGDVKELIGLSALLGNFLKETRTRHTLTTNRMHVGKGRPPQNSITLQGDHSRLEVLRVHRAANGMLRIDQGYFREWCSKHGYSPTLTIDRMIQEFGAKKVLAILGGGTDYATFREQVLEMDLSGTVFDDITE